MLECWRWVECGMLRFWFVAMPLVLLLSLGPAMLVPAGKGKP
jgi:hypothetical protein